MKACREETAPGEAIADSAENDERFLRKGRTAMGMLPMLFRLLEKPQKAAVGRFALLCLISPAADLLGVSMMIPVLQQAFQEDGRMTGQILFLSLLLLLTGVFELVKGRASTALVMDISHDWSLKIYELYGMEELEDHSKKTAMQAISGARTDPAVCARIIPSCMGLVVDLLTVMFYAAAMTFVARAVGALSCVLVAALMAALYWYSRIHAVRFGERQRQLEIRAGGMVSTMFGSYKEIKIDSRRGVLLERYRQASAECAQIQKDHNFTKGLQGVVLQNVMQSALFLTLAGLLWAGADLSHILPDMVIFITLLTRMLPVSKRIVEALTDLHYAVKYCEALQESLGRCRALRQAKADRALLREKRVTLDQGIRVEGLSFHYANGKQIFENASMEVPAGVSTAVIGLSGEGKTTLLDLILGLLHPQAGHIWYDDLDIVEGRDGQGPCRADIGAAVSYIPQIVYLNNETVRGNVTFLAGEEGQDEERIIECLQCAQIWEDVREMPEGLDTLIGENGTTISGGQRQRIALARALYKKCEILIMDEATAALDMDTERAVHDAIRQMQGTKTLLMVTHHMSLADMCERVYKLENRQLVRVR